MYAERPGTLPRGYCPKCGRYVALRTGGQVREHHRRIGPKMVDEAVCPGSGLLRDQRSPHARSKDDGDW